MGKGQTYTQEYWFHDNLDGHAAENLLKSDPAPGTFLFRSSSTAGNISLSYKDDKGGVNHVRVTVNTLPSGACAFLCVGDPKEYANLRALVDARLAVLKTPILAKKGKKKSDLDEMLEMGYTKEQAMEALKSGSSVQNAISWIINRSRDLMKGSGPDGEKATATSLFKNWGYHEDQNPIKNYMEDRWAAIPDFDGRMSYFAVYDGHGGKSSVEWVQANVHQYLLHEIQAGYGIQEAFTNAFFNADNALRNIDHAQSGCVVVSALLCWNGEGTRSLHVANLGDSRCIACQGKTAVPMTEDHNTKNEAEAALVVANGGTILWGKVQGKLSVTRALADFDCKPLGGAALVSCKPYYSTIYKITDDYKFLVLACDGIFDVMENQQVIDTCLAVKSKDPSEMAKSVVNTALAKGSKDNVTCVVVNLI